MSKASRSSTTTPAAVARRTARPAGAKATRRTALASPAPRREPDTLAQHATAYVTDLKASAALRSMELIGMAEDGRMFLWSTGNVQPVHAFENAEWDTTGRMIAGGHFVIDWRGHAIVVDCSPGQFGDVVVLFMCSGGYGFRASREAVEPLLLARVVPDPVVEAEILEGIQRLTEAYTARQQAPHRARGRAAA